jgi:hypothetical protein
MMCLGVIGLFGCSKPIQTDGPFFVMFANGRAGYMDVHGTIAIKPAYHIAWPFSEGLAAVQILNRVGYIDKSGTMIIPPHYLYGGPFKDGVAFVKEGPRTWGLIDKTGAPVTDIKFDPCFNGHSGIPTFHEGLACVDIGASYNNSIGFVNTSGELVSKGFRERAIYSDGLAKIDWYPDIRYIDSSGHTTVKLPRIHMESSRNFVEGLAAFQLRRDKGELWGFLDKSGMVKIEAQYKSVSDFSDGLAAVIAQNNHLYFIDQGNNRVAQPPQTTSFLGVVSYTEGMAAVFVTGGLIYVQNTGKVLPMTCEDMLPFTNGLAWVHCPAIKATGYINRSGEFVWKASKNVGYFEQMKDYSRYVDKTR